MNATIYIYTSKYIPLLFISTVWCCRYTLNTSVDIVPFSYICSENVPDVGTIYLRVGLVEKWMNEWMQMQ